MLRKSLPDSTNMRLNTIYVNMKCTKYRNDTLKIKIDIPFLQFIIITLLAASLDI